MHIYVPFDHAVFINSILVISYQAAINMYSLVSVFFHHFQWNS